LKFDVQLTFHGKISVPTSDVAFGNKAGNLPILTNVKCSLFIFATCSINWEARKQQTVALSSTEAEYTALSDATKEAIYLRRFLKEVLDCWT
jgi:hypothetical protein